MNKTWSEICDNNNDNYNKYNIITTNSYCNTNNKDYHTTNDISNDNDTVINDENNDIFTTINDANYDATNTDDNNEDGYYQPMIISTYVFITR